MASPSVAAPDHFDLLNYVPASDYHAALVIQPSVVFSAPLVADNLEIEEPRRLSARLDGLKKLTGVDARADLDAVVLAGNPPRRHRGQGDGVLLVQGRWDKARILDALSNAPEYAEKQLGGQTCYAFYAPKANGDKALAFLSDTVLVLGNESAVQAVVEQGGVAAGSLAANESFQSMARQIPAGTAFWLLVRSPGEIGPVPQFRPVSANLVSFASWGLLSDTLTVESRLEADTPEHAQEMLDAFQGFRAIGRLQLDNPARGDNRPIDGLKPLIDKVRLTVEDNTVKVSMEFTGEELLSLREARSRIRDGVKRLILHRLAGGR